MDVENFKLELQKIEAQRTRLENKRKKLLETCTHPDTRVDKKYHDSGYDYFASTTVKVICNICGKTISKEEVEHRWR